MECQTGKKEEGVEMRTYKAVLATLALATMAALLVVGCGARSVNVVRAAGLSNTVEIEITEVAESGYLHQVTITDSQIIDRIVAALNQDLELGPGSLCMARYKLRFHLTEGAVQEFEYSCGNGGWAFFLRGDQDFWHEQEPQPPARFDELIQDALASTE